MEVVDSVAEISFNRPEALNAIDEAMADVFASTVQSLLAAGKCSVVVLKGSPRAFNVGVDLAMLRAAGERAPAVIERLVARFHSALQALADSPVIVVASVQGVVAGAGLSLVLTSDLAIASDDATFKHAYINVAASPDCGGSWALPRIVGLRKAMEIALLSETISAQDALALGIVNRTTTASLLRQDTTTLANRLAATPNFARAQIKQLFRKSLDRTLDEQLHEEKRAILACATHADFREAVDAFFEKRPRRRESSAAVRGT
jgi:2-(1,2-epoxy-1,2-dihydrophenyl)acetyl-CoA isomerase